MDQFAFTRTIGSRLHETLPRELAGERGAGQDSCRRFVFPNGERVTEAISEPFYKQIAQEIENSQWIAIPTDQLLGPDTGRVFNDASADIAAGNMTAEQAAKTIEKSWEQNKE